MSELSESMLEKEIKIQPNKPNFTQLVYFDLTSKAGTQRPLMARIALAVSGQEKDCIVDLRELWSTLGWINYQATLALLSQRISVDIVWEQYDLAQLIMWAKQ